MTDITQISEGKLYRIPEVAEILNMNEQTVTFRIKQGILKAVPHKKWQHYRVFGFEIKKYLGLGSERDINKLVSEEEE